MVAVKGKGWQLNPLLVRAEQEANAKAPDRSKASDGSIGDAEHASRESFHNPWEGWVDALDLTNDPARGFDVHAEFRRLTSTKDPVLAALDHLISNRQIASAARGWVWREYTGPNPHDKHGHMAGKRNSVARSYAGPIFLMEDDMAGEGAEILGILKGPYTEALNDIRGSVAYLLKHSGDDVDEAELAKQLAPLLTAQLPRLSDADLKAVAKAVADEDHRRSAG